MEEKSMKITFLFAAMAVLAGCSGSPLIEKDTGLSFGLDGDLKEVLYYASLAPNGHNTQMWKVGVSGGGSVLRVYLDSSRLLPAVDPEGRESLISAGAFTENLCRALAAYGYDYTLSLAESADVRANPLVAQVTLGGKTGAPPDAASLALMEKRHSEKGIFLDKAPEAQAVSRVLAAVNGAGGADADAATALYYEKGSAEFAYIKEKSVEANEIQAESAAVREELALWLRFSDEEAREKADGLPAEQLGLSGIVKKAYYLTTDREKAAGEKFGKTSLKLAKKQLSGCTGFFLIQGGDAVRAHIKAGMAMEALWLAAAAEGISIHPMSQALEEGNVPPPVQMIMRAGYVKDYGENAKIRRPIKEFVFLEN
jgi:hypothetical protein